MNSTLACHINSPFKKNMKKSMLKKNVVLNKPIVLYNACIYIYIYMIFMADALPSFLI